MHITAPSETWLTNAILDGQVNIDDYRLFRRDRKSRPRGGVCTYFHHSLQVQLLPVTNPNLGMFFLKFRVGKQVYVRHRMFVSPPPSALHFGPIWTLRWRTLKAKKLSCWVI